MNGQRFDAIVLKLTNEWEFDALVDFFWDNAVSNSKQLEFCVFLADLGLLDQLHHFISENGLYALRAQANDPKNKSEKSENVKSLLNVYESEMLEIFERHNGAPPDIYRKLLSFSQYADSSIVANHIIKNKDVIFNSEQHPKNLMYLAFAINKSLAKTPDPALLALLLDKLDVFKKMNAIRKAFITKSLTTCTLTNSDHIKIPKVGYNGLHKLLGIITPQKTKFDGAGKLYSLVIDAVRPELTKLSGTRFLGWDSKPRVAVCVSGMYRCGNLALNSLHQNIIEPLNADVFFHTWEDMHDWPGLGGAGDDWLRRIFGMEIFNKCPTALQSKKFFKENFPRTYKIIDTPDQSRFDTSILPIDLEFKRIKLENASDIFEKQGINKENFASMGSLNQAKMLYGIYIAHELAVEYEKEHGFRYDYFIRCRPDIGVRNPMSFSTLEMVKPNEVAMDFTKDYGAQDQFWYSQRNPALTMASLWASSVANGGLSPYSDFPQLRAHGLILAWMTGNNLQPVLTPVKRDMKMVLTETTPPNFSRALAEDFENEAYDLRQNQAVLDFFAALMEHNR